MKRPGTSAGQADRPGSMIIPPRTRGRLLRKTRYLFKSAIGFRPPEGPLAAGAAPPLPASSGPCGAARAADTLLLGLYPDSRRNESFDRPLLSRYSVTAS